MSLFQKTIQKVITTIVFGLTSTVAQAGLIYGDSTERTFDGSNFYSAGYNSEYSQQTPFSMAATFTITAAEDDWVRVMGRGDHINRNYGLWYHQQSNYFLFQAYGSGGFEVLYRSGVSLNTEYSMVGVLDGNIAKLYLNGAEVGSQTKNGLPLASDLEPLTIGGASFHSIHQGTVSDVGLWDHALSSSEIAAYSESGITQVSEPITLALFGFGLAGIAIRKKRQERVG